MSASPILDQEDFQSLQREDTVISVQGAATQRLHKRRLNRYSEEEYNDVPLPNPPSSVVSPGGTTADNLDNFVTIPEHLISRETLNYLGFDDGAADTIWSRWVNWGPDQGREIDGGPVTFLSMSEAYITGAGEDVTSDDDTTWRTSMASIGINEALQAAIMTPRCKDVRLTESCKYWLLDTVVARYASLEQIQTASRERSRAAHRASTRPGGTQRQSIPPGQPMSTRIRVTSEIFNGGPSLSPMTTTAPEVRANAPGHTVLYRGMFQTNLPFMFNAEGDIVSLAGLFSQKQGDFHARGTASYMALDFEVANKYAYFAKRRDSNQLAVIVRLEIPNSALESMHDTEKVFAYWPSQDWKHLIWNCRRQYRLRNEWTRFVKATLVIGTICGKPDKVIQKLQSPTDITHNMVFQGPRGDAIQYVFIGEQGEDFLERYMSQNITVHPMTRQIAEEMSDEDL
ncbi:hypothetical protein QQZ08_011361 [Neonectria magnoliae]|uniref:Uncharacterized protein n=1 Tax=Neonectria magnoliae TaxID=2732573 RepID=A0ABR1HAM7_9HYPO